MNNSLHSKLVSHARRWFGSPVGDFAATAEEARQLEEEATGPLAEIFFSGRGRRVHKWVHYLPIYDRYFSAMRGTQFKFLEIGVFGGGSLDMWREYFGPDAKIFGVDVNPACAELDTE